MTWKHIWLVVVVTVLFTSAAHAQTHEATRYGELNLKGFAAPELAVTTVDGEMMVLAGGRLAALIEPEFYLGITAYTGVNQPTAPEVWRGNQWLATHYGMLLGGVVAGYAFHPEDDLHWGGELMLGVGSVSREVSDGGSDLYSPDPDNLYYAQPMVRGVWRGGDWWRLSLGVGFRLVGAVDRLGLDGGAASGPVVGLAIEAGIF